MGFADWVSVHYTKIWAGGAERNDGEFGIIPAEMNARLKTTLKAWPVVTAATVAVCYLTKTAAELCGIELPDQENITVVKQLVEHMFDSTRHFHACMRLFATVLFVMPAIEEFVFRYLLFRLPTRAMGASLSDLHVAAAVAAISSALFSAAHYLAQPFPDAAFIALFFFGFAQCWLYMKTDRIWCTMLNHCLFNLANLVLAIVSIYV